MSSQPISVLIVEDDRVSSRILERHLKGWGYKTYVVQDGEQAWNLFQTRQVEIAILDWIPPGVDGLELGWRMRQKMSPNRGDYVYIILLTARDEKSDLLQGLKAGADDYITKPLDLVELKARLSIARRIVELRRLLKRQADYDSLTGLLNRRRIMETAEQEYARCLREKQPLGLILIDIDDFKAINDSFGHTAGDKILAEVAGRLKRRIRAYDKIGRYGGDELLVVLSRCDTKRLKSIGERLCQAASEKPVEINQKAIPVSISAGGIASNSHPSLSLQDLISLCDRALYQAKHAGRNRATIIDSVILKGESA